MADQPTSPPPAYFLSLSLENVRSFGEKQTISFAREDGRPAQWTIILGDNGVGKTTVLKSLALMMPDFQPQAVAGAVGFISDLKYNWYFIRNARHSETRIECITNTGPLLLSALANVKSDLHNTYIYHASSADALKDGILGGSYGGTKKLMGLICYGYGAGRTTGNSTLSEAPKTLYTCASLFDDRADLLNPEEWFLFADYRMAKDKDPLTTQNFHLIKAALLKIMEEGEVTDLEVAPVQSGGGSPRQGVRFKTPYGWVRLRDMSLGYQTLVVWLTDFADKLFVRYPNSKNPLEEPAIVLIDEIDLHLHPSWQRKLIKSLSEIFINTQFIATAHSPLVVQAASDADANVVLLKREGDQTIVHQNTEDVRGWRLDQILTSELFGLDTARSLETEQKLQRRAELLNKPELTAAEKKILAQLTQELNAEPVGETPSEREVNTVLQELRQRLLTKDPNATAA